MHSSIAGLAGRLPALSGVKIVVAPEASGRGVSLRRAR
jgi:hypothetical protein